jgi:hypothetical protein
MLFAMNAKRFYYSRFTIYDLLFERGYAEKRKTGRQGEEFSERRHNPDPVLPEFHCYAQNSQNHCPQFGFD